MERKKSLAPVINNQSSMLILGSMPGEESLRRQEYYGFSGNHFWKLTAAVFGEETPETYALKLGMLRRNRIALWDVIESCTREGSLDVMIRNETPNSLPVFLNDHPNIKAVFFNGQKAALSFKRSFGLNLLEANGLYWKILPSSSPANTIGFERKLEKWMELINY